MGRDIFKLEEGHGLNVFTATPETKCIKCDREYHEMNESSIHRNDVDACVVDIQELLELVCRIDANEEIEEDMGKKKWKNESGSYGSSIYPGSGTTGNYAGTKQKDLWSTTSYVSHKQCPKHTGKKVIWIDKERGIELAGAQGSEVIVDNNLALVVDLAGLFKPASGGDAIKFRSASSHNNTTASKDTKDWNTKMSSLSKHVSSPAVLRIQNPDMGIPPVGFTFWQELYNLLPRGRTVCCCVGGHGRTGTALAALILAGDNTRTAQDAIDIVRKDHCENAIESDLQETYLQMLADERASLTKN
jgi:hypothetical protein